jgi:ferredoxin-NADP reductase
VERAALLGRLKVLRAPLVWQLATVTGLIDETSRVKTILLDVSGWPGHAAGQHVDVRLTAEDGYQTQRSYSIASAPEDATLALTVERIADGEVSPYLTDELRPGDTLELRGPVGGYFTWRTADGGPLLLIAGGSGLVPLMAMLRHRAARSSTIDTRLLVSARSPEDALYHDELANLGAAVRLAVCYTAGSAQEIDAKALRALGPTPARRPRIFVSGPTKFVGSAADLLSQLGHDATTIRLEDFGTPWDEAQRSAS